MTCNPPKSVAVLRGLGRLGRRPCTRPLTRWLGALLAVALFGVDTFQPIIGLVEVPRGADQARPAGEPAEAPQPVVVSIQAWQWQHPIGELWPAFVFQPTINAGSGGSAAAAGFTPLGSGALPPTTLAWSLPVPAALHWLAAPVDAAPLLRVSCCCEIRPVGPPLA